MFLNRHNNNSEFRSWSHEILRSGKYCSTIKLFKLENDPSPTEMSVCALKILSSGLEVVEWRIEAITISSLMQMIRSKGFFFSTHSIRQQDSRI